MEGLETCPDELEVRMKVRKMLRTMPMAYCLPPRERSRLNNRLTTLQNNGLIGFNRKVVWLATKDAV